MLFWDGLNIPVYYIPFVISNAIYAFYNLYLGPNVLAASNRRYTLFFGILGVSKIHYYMVLRSSYNGSKNRKCSNLIIKCKILEFIHFLFCHYPKPKWKIIDTVFALKKRKKDEIRSKYVQWSNKFKALKVWKTKQ